MEKMIFRKVERTEIPAIMELYREHIGEAGCTWNEYYPCEEFAEEDVAADGLYAVTENDLIVAVGTIVHDIELSEYDGWDNTVKNPFEISRIAVKRGMTDKGIGSALIAFLEDECRSRGADALRLLVSEANAPAMALYKKSGFKPRGHYEIYDRVWLCLEKII